MTTPPTSPTQADSDELRRAAQQYLELEFIGYTANSEADIRNARMMAFHAGYEAAYTLGLAAGRKEALAGAVEGFVSEHSEGISGLVVQPNSGMVFYTKEESALGYHYRAVPALLLIGEKK